MTHMTLLFGGWLPVKTWSVYEVAKHLRGILVFREKCRKAKPPDRQFRYFVFLRRGSIIQFWNNMDVNITKIRSKFSRNFAFLYFCGSTFSYFCKNAKMRKYEMAISSIRILIIKSNIMLLLELRIILSWKYGLKLVAILYFCFSEFLYFRIYDKMQNYGNANLLKWLNSILHRLEGDIGEHW